MAERRAGRPRPAATSTRRRSSRPTTSTGPSATSGSSGSSSRSRRSCSSSCCWSYARHGARFARESAAGRIGTGMLLGMLGLGLVWLSQVPFRLVEVWWQRRHDQTELGYVESLFDDWLALGAAFLVISLALAIVMALAGRFPTAVVGRRGARLRRARRALRVHRAVPLHRRGPPTRSCAPTLGASRRSKGSSRFRVAVEDVSAPTRSHRTPTRPATGRRSGSSSGTRCSTAASRTARSASSSPTSWRTTPATTSSRGSRGSPSSRSRARG